MTLRRGTPQSKKYSESPNIGYRLNYVLWVQDIITELQYAVPFVLRYIGGESICAVHGLDIGTGASAIYPLLACSLEPTWKFTATELDDVSYTHAQSNIRTNGLSDRIRILKVEADSNDDGPRFGFDCLLDGHNGKPGAELGTSPTKADPLQNDHAEMEIQFTMCNPPFYSSAADIRDSEARKEHSAFGVCTGAPVEMITPGGEVHFVKGMIRESLYGCKDVSVDTAGDNNDDGKVRKRRRVGEGNVLSADEHPAASSRSSSLSGPRWYTSMLGKMGSVVEVVGVFKELGITNYAITEFVQGQTRRWAVGWCVDGWRLSDDITRITSPNPTLQRLLPPRNTLRFDITKDKKDAQGCLENVLCGMEDATVTPYDAIKLEDDMSSYVVFVTHDTWSRGARRKRKREQEKAVDGDGVDNEGGCPPALVCSVILRQWTEGDRAQMDVQWLYGKGRSLLESFASHVAQKLNNSGG
ncbi:hypothetical protein C0995_001617 [Termitomyces sp. Mi166|nr:hypothetical protein C0995_001617 [Termitomyces sp. Mi166\